MSLGGELQGGEVVALIGELGAGKTVFVKGMAKSFGISEDEVESPTFTLINIYDGRKKLYHVDLYRIEGEDEMLEAEIWEAVDYNSIIVVEWAEKFKSLLRMSSVKVKIEVEGEERRIEIERN